jgi:short-subunit dehydrogenase
MTTTSFAVVTGASSGIGFELARQFVEHDFDVLITAEDDELATAAARLGESGRAVHAIGADLRRAAGVEELYAAIQELGRPVDALALNAGVGQGGAFVDQSLADIQSVVQLNVASTVHLARLILADMVARGAGRVLVTSSVASLMPGSYQAVYNASKSFVQSFAQGLQAELADSPVTVTSLMPGPTDTEFFGRADMADDTMIGRGPKDDPAQVAEQGFAALMAGKRRVVGGGLQTRAQYVAGTVLPDRVKAAMHTVMARPRRRSA